MTTQRKIIKGLLAITGFILGIVFVFYPEGISHWTIRIIGGYFFIYSFLAFGALFNEFKN